MSFFDGLKDNWHARPEKERSILLVVGLFVFVSLFYLLVVDPMLSWKEREQKNIVTNERIHAQVVRLVNRFEQQNSPSQAVAKNLAVVIDKSLQENNLAMKGFQPGRNNDARLRLSGVAYEPLMQWLYDIEHKHGVVIEELSISQAKTNGLLIANIRVRQ